MRKKIFVISILICSNVIYSFASSKIGYKDFALGDTSSDVEKKCLKHNPNYRCCVLKIDSSTSVSFEYYNKIVMKIEVITDYVTVEDYNNLVKYLKNKYGKPTEISDHDIPSYTWYFNKKRYSIESHFAGEDQMQVFYIDRTLEKKSDDEWNAKQHKDY